MQRTLLPRTLEILLLSSSVRSTLSKMSTGTATKDALKSSNLFDVSHVTAVLTGGGSGIGLMIVQVRYR